MADLSIFKLDSQTITIKDTTARQAAESAKALATTASGNATTALNKVNEQFTELKNDLVPFPAGANSKYGTSGQLLRTLGNGETEWVDQGLPFVTPEMFGAKGDGVADDTQAFVSACQSGRPVFVNNSKIGACSIANCEVKCNKLILTGKVTCKSLNICGNIEVNGGSFYINRTSNDVARDDSNFENVFFDIVNCDTLITVSGTLYNSRFLNITVRKKCNVSVFTFDADEWITYILIKDCFLGTCDTPIIIEGKVDGLQIVNTFAQRYNPIGACRFISTGARGCKLVLSSSFMYDLVSDTNDTQIYLDRGLSGEFNYGQKFLISASGQLGASPFSPLFAQDSNGATGAQLANEISGELNDLNGQLIIKRPIKNARSAFDFYENINDFTSYGSAIDIAIPSLLSSAGADVVGVAYKFGTGNNSKSAEVIIGTKANGDIVTIRRDADDQTFKVKGYTDTSNFVGSAESPSALITDLNTIPVNFMGTKRLDASISPTGSAFYAPMVRFGNVSSGGIFAVRPTNGVLYFAALNAGTWGAWKTVTLT